MSECVVHPCTCTYMYAMTITLYEHTVGLVRICAYVCISILIIHKHLCIHIHMHDTNTHTVYTCCIIHMCTILCIYVRTSAFDASVLRVEAETPCSNAGALHQMILSAVTLYVVQVYRTLSRAKECPLLSCGI